MGWISLWIVQQGSKIEDAETAVSAAKGIESVGLGHLPPPEKLWTLGRFPKTNRLNSEFSEFSRH
jgi:hypothetical protein